MKLSCRALNIFLILPFSSLTLLNSFKAAARTLGHVLLFSFTDPNMVFNALTSVVVVDSFNSVVKLSP